MRDGATPKVPDGMSSRAAQRADMPESWCGPAHRGLLLVAFGFIALLGAQLLLVTSIPGTSYDGADGMAAQAEILATMEFARPFEITNLNPLQGLWPQMMPMNVWVNPAYWPFAFFHKELAADVSGIVALICYALACYLMARLFDLPRLPSIIAAQLTIMLFAPAARALAFSAVFVSIPGLAIVYAPHLLALGLLARLSPERPQVFIAAAGILMLLFYSLYCDPLWTMVSGVDWIVPFGVVAFSPLRWDTILVRCAVLGSCVIVLLLSGALEYVYSLLQYTARVQFPDLLQRPRLPEFASVIFRSNVAKYFYWACVPGWTLGIWLLHGRAQALVLAAAASAVSLVAYATAYLYLELGNWVLPLPIYIEHALFAPLFGTAAIAGYRGGVEGLFALARRWTHEADRAERGASRWQGRLQSLSPQRPAVVTEIAAMLTISIVLVLSTFKASKYANFWYEPWSNEPELREYLGNKIGLRVNSQFRGSVLFYTGGYDEFLTLDSLWVDAVPTINEYSQLVTPQAIYFTEQLLKRNVSSDLNWFLPWINSGNGSFAVLFRTLRALGV